jgi:hypothetical protein
MQVERGHAWGTIPTCRRVGLFTLSPRPSCTADSRAALRATAPVWSLVHAWPCFSPLQPLLRLPFLATPIRVIFCVHLTFHHSLSRPISHFPPRFPCAFLTAFLPILAHSGRCKSTCMNSMQTGIMLCATFRTVPFQQSSSHSFESYPIRTFRALVFLKAHSHAKCFSAKWQHYNGGAWLKL